MVVRPECSYAVVDYNAGGVIDRDVGGDDDGVVLTALLVLERCCHRITEPVVITWIDSVILAQDARGSGAKRRDRKQNKRKTARLGSDTI